MVSIYRSGTEYVANALTFTRGSAADVVSVSVFHSEDPNDIPDVVDFTEVTLVDGVADPEDPLATAGVIDVLSLIGPRDGQVTLTAGTYQRYVLVSTATEDIIRRVDTLEIL